MKTMCTYMDRQSDRLQKRKLLPEYLDALGVPMGKTIMDAFLEIKYVAPTMGITSESLG